MQGWGEKKSQKSGGTICINIHYLFDGGIREGEEKLCVTCKKKNQSGYFICKCFSALTKDLPFAAV